MTTNMTKDQIKEQARNYMIQCAREANDWVKLGLTYDFLDGLAWTSCKTWMQTSEACFKHLTWQEIDEIAHSVFDGKSIKDFAPAEN